MKKRIGDFLVQKNILTESQVEQILNYSVQTGLRFGEAAQELGFLNPETLEKVFGPNHRADFYYLETEHFQSEWIPLLSKDLVIRLGALPLGFTEGQSLFKKKKVLNLGFLNPMDSTKVQAAEAALRAHAVEFDKVKPFLILVEPFIEILGERYGVSETELQSMDPASVDENIQLYLKVTK